VVGANAMVEVHGKKIRGRQYPWGVVEVENPAHCDFVKLRTMLITHMQDLQVNPVAEWMLRLHYLKATNCKKNLSISFFSR
jgi:hypothetical protein